jgi:drug/metabolite transporter (DMT)-like permease
LVQSVFPAPQKGRVVFDDFALIKQIMKTNARFYALLAATLFGASAPFSKMLLGNLPPLQLAGLLYLGCGIGLLLVKTIQVLLKKSGLEAHLQRTDLFWLLGAVCCGGILAPIALMFGLSHTPAATASVLLNFEAASTTLLAGFFFREHIGKWVIAAIVLLTLASIILSLEFSGRFGFSSGALLVLLACFFWGIDNNVTRNISAKDPVIIVIVKGLCAGSFSFVLSILTGSHIPNLSHTAFALIVGAICYGASLLLFILALRDLGSARSSALFATAPFIGAVISFIVCKDVPTVQFIISVPLMIVGIFLLFRESHEHSHEHEYVEHDHFHDHTDAHHDHPHAGINDDADKHSHKHCHESVVHFHNHMPDIHHRHGHS